MPKILVLAFTLIATNVWAQGATTLAIDLRKVPPGSWAEYTYSMKPENSETMGMTTRWSMVARDGTSNTMEMQMSGGPTAVFGGVVVVAMVLAADPVISANPIKRVVLQVGKSGPMEIPPGLPILPIMQTKFAKPNPKNRVGKEVITVPGGTFKTIHYHTENGNEVEDTWISEQVPPLGIIRAESRTLTGAGVFTMELSGKGNDGKPVVVGPIKPFDLSKLKDGKPLN